jgi:fibronectin-binding autotransporter adhesin
MKTTRVLAPRARTVLSVSILAVLANAPSAQAQTTDTWSLGTSGLWSVATNWSAGVPSGDNVDIIDGVSTVTLNTGAGIDSLTIGSGNSLIIDAGNTLALSGPTISNKGSIQLNGGADGNGVLSLGANVTLSGSGALTLSSVTGSGAAYIEQNTGGVTLTNQSTIQGSGIIGNGGLTLVNSGTIDANTAAGGGMLLNASGGITNTGILEATGGGALTLSSVPVTNTGANITASGSGSVVNIANSTITGGTLTASGGAALNPTGNDTLSGVTIASGTTYPVTAGNTTYLTGPFTNNGTLSITGNSSGNAVVSLNSNVTLAGPVTMSSATGGGNAYIEQNEGDLTLTTTGTVQGSGIIGNGGLTLVNSGTIDGNTTAGGGMLLNSSGGITNTGTLEATAGGALTISSVSVTNTGANITASGSGSVVNISNSTITGGTLTASGGAALNPTGNDTLSGVTIATGTTYPITAGNTTYLTGTFTNDGTVPITASSAGNAVLSLNNSVTLGGTVTLSSATGGGSAYIYENEGGLKLTTTGTVQGSGIIGNGGLALDNTAKGVIDANASGTGISTELTLNGSGGITNTGLLEATNGDTLSIQAAVANASGKITASGTNSVVSLAGATVSGGTLNSSGGGAIVATNNTILNGVTISSGSTVTAPTDNSTFFSGTTTNDGTIVINAGGGTNGVLELNASTTLAGGGKVTLAEASGGGTDYIQQSTGGLKLTNTNNTIQGEGIIGNGGLTVVNSSAGTISSDVSGGSLVLNGSGGLTNSGTLQVSSGAVLQVSTGPFTNFSGTTLTGGTYNVSGTLEIDELGTAGGEIVTDAANIILDGTAAKFVDADGNSALTKLATIAAKSSFTLSGDADFTTAGNFDNKGTLTVGAGSVFDVKGKLLNFSGTTLTGGTYDVTGKLEFAGANIETNDAAITLTGKTAEIVNTTTRKNGLANFATNEAKGIFTIAGGANLTTAGSVSNAGTFAVGTGSTLTVGGPGVFTQTAGTTVDSGTLTASGGVALSGGSLFAGGTITGNLASSGIVTPGASATKTGILTDTGTYTQNSGGSLNIGIGGTAVGTKFDALNATTAVLGGTLNISELSSFIPTVGSTFKILSFNSVTGTFATVNGLTINSTEEYTVTYQPTDVLLTVVSTAAPARQDSRIDEGTRLTAALQEFNAAYAKGGRLADAGRNDGMAPRPRLERIRAMDLIKKGAKQ